MNREDLIALSVHYEGEYHKLIKAINNNEMVKHIICNNCFTIFDDIYPKVLLNLKYPPLVLFYKGNLDLLKEDAIAIVGSRNPCEYASKATKALTMHYQDKVIISGLAKGIDAIAHQYANKTIGVLGCGIDYIYPQCNRQLIAKVANEGLVISEYPGLTKPLGYHFPFRNRIIACLANSIYVMQSNIKSGTMTTVNQAIELGKDVRVLPYDIFNENGINNNNLIYEGANMIEHNEIAF